MTVKRSSLLSHLSHAAWNGFCLLSVVGIWPRFIEPRLIFSTRLNLPFKFREKQKELTVVQVSDLHHSQDVSDAFLQKLTKRIRLARPDLILFTGDFLCRGNLSDRDRLSKFLKGLNAPMGSYAVLGNHDYEQPLTVNAEGDYDIEVDHASPASKIFTRLFMQPKLTGKVTERARKLAPQIDLLDLLREAGVRLLNNSTVQAGETLNITGVGEHMAGQVDVKKAYKDYNPALPGILLAHNPDALSQLENAPSELILCGHAHGGGVNLPWLWKKLTALENPRFKKGLHPINQKNVYVSRGLGAIMPFRFNAVPELVVIKLFKETL